MPEVICSTCLSINRRLVSLDREKYGSLFGNETTSVIENLDSVCWECINLFRKLYKFKLQVLQAQTALKSTGPMMQLMSLSHLSSSMLCTNDICCDQNIRSDDKLNTIKADLVPNVKLESDINTENSFVKNYFITIDGMTDENNIASISLDTSIKHEDDYDVLSDDVIVEELKETKTKKLKRSSRKSDISRKKVKIERNDKEKVKRDNTMSVTKNNYILTDMTEEEMQAKRETDKQADRYKNKVKYRCELCIVGFFRQEKYDKHMRIRHSEKAGNYQCTICKTRFTTSKFYRDHIEGHYTKYKCKLCGYNGYKLSEMVSHDAKEHDLLRFICKVCQEEFPSPSSLRFHRETVHEAPVKCELCGKMYKTKNNLRIHTQQMHRYNPKTACTVCGERVRYIQIHMRKHSATPEGAYCAECDQRFSSTASYKSHLKYAARHRAPDTVLRHGCRVCDAKFINSSALKKHALARHSTVRPFKCDRCGKGFEAQWRMRRHILHIHEGVEKPRDKICHICGRGFTNKSMLANHIRVHTGEKPFRCEICSAAFSQKSTLTTHTRGVHLKIKPRPGRGQNP